MGEKRNHRLEAPIRSHFNVFLIVTAVLGYWTGPSVGLSGPVEVIQVKGSIPGAERIGVKARPEVEKNAHSARRTTASDVHTYAGESLEWDPCGQITNHPVECSSLDVPMDQFGKVNSGGETFSIPLVRMRGKNATENLFLNPGGAGAGGIEFLYSTGELLNSIVGEGFHLLFFDPRGVNGSRPIATCYRDEEVNQRLSDVHNTDPIADSPGVYAWTTNFVRACEDNMGEHGKYINTPQTAADMNSILDALGQEKMAYWGLSYGSLLGQTYATMFPERPTRVIIDGVANVFDLYSVPLEDKDFIDGDKVIFGIFDECIKAGNNCPMAALDNSAEGLYRKFLDFAEDLKEEPISVYVNSTLYGNWI